eukprot:GEMP01052344.1.p1 GENE.GEMP01052344.1~~GEMP01052344.1.p1  ORF type:complete len:241 (+),score=49.39 GEMP01052344.1:127-849(+)
MARLFVYLVTLQYAATATPVVTGLGSIEEEPSETLFESMGRKLSTGFGVFHSVLGGADPRESAECQVAGAPGGSGGGGYGGGGRLPPCPPRGGGGGQVTTTPSGGGGQVTTTPGGGGGQVTTTPIGGGGSKNGGNGAGRPGSTGSEAAMAAANRSGEEDSLSTGSIIGLLLACLTLFVVCIVCFRRMGPKKGLREDQEEGMMREKHPMQFPNFSTNSNMKSSRSAHKSSKVRGSSEHNRE